jgi:hypothetical protein
MKRTIKTPNDYIIDGDSCLIGCYDKHSELVGYTIIDAEDIDKVRSYKWCFGDRYIMSNSTGVTVRIHNLIKTPLEGNRVDHIDGNAWDNRKSNLRLCDNSQNNCNKTKQKNNKSGYKGVSWDKQTQKWGARIQKNRKSYHLGFYPTAEEAATAYNTAAKELHGVFAHLTYNKGE